jgi:hypothetical protein
MILHSCVSFDGVNRVWVFGDYIQIFESFLPEAAVDLSSLLKL